MLYIATDRMEIFRNTQRIVVLAAMPSLEDVQNLGQEAVQALTPWINDQNFHIFASLNEAANSAFGIQGGFPPE